MAVLLEPNVPTKCPFPPLHTTLFSIKGIKSTNRYRKNNSKDTIDELVQGIRVLFYEDTTWFLSHRNELKRYACWCNQLGDNYELSLIKCAEYISYRCNEIREQKTDDGIAVTLFNKTRFIITTLERLAKWQGYTELSSNLSQKGRVEIIYKDLLRLQNKEKLSEYVDYAGSSRRVSKRFTNEERQKIICNLWDPSSSFKTHPKQVMRRLIQQLLPAADGRRGEDLREIKIAMLQTHYLNKVGPAKCHVVGASIRVVKERIFNNETLVGWGRAKNRDECPIGGLACYLVWLLDIQGVPLLDLMKQDLINLQNLTQKESYKPKWRTVYLLHGDDTSKPLSYSRHNNDVHDIFQASGISKVATTHVHRTDLICRQTESGVPHIESRIHQGFEHTTSTDIYLRGGFNVSAMLPAVGWESHKSYYCWWESDGKDIPDDLRCTIFPQLDAISRLAERSTDVSAKEVCKLLHYLRKVYIEDAVYRQPKYPEFPAYQHPIFLNGTFKNIIVEYSTQESKRVLSREEDFKRKDADILTKISNQEENIQTLSNHIKLLLGTQLNSDKLHVTRCVEEPHLPLPSMPQIVVDIRSLYDMYVDTWKQLFKNHTDYYQKCMWTKCFNKQDAAVSSKRWHMYKDFLYFMDTLDPNDKIIAFTVLESFAQKNNLDHNKLIKKVFYHCVRPNTIPDKEINNLPDLLYQELTTNGIVLVQIDTKQDHSKKSKYNSLLQI